MTLAEARAKVAEMRRPVEDSSMTVADAFQQFHRHLKRVFKRPEITERRFVKDILPHIGTTLIHRLTRAEVAHMLDKIVARGSPVAANRTLADIKKLTAFAHERGWTAEDPLIPLTRKAVGGRESSRDRNLSFDEIADFLDVLRSPDNDMSEGTRWALYFCLLTGCRATEALWCLSHKNLEIPTEVCKTRPHRVPDTPGVRAVLKLATGEVPKDHRVLSHALRRLKQTFTPHDLRRTLSSRLGDLGVAPHVSEKLLNHKMVGVMAVYNRAEYWPDRLAAQRIWERKLAELRKRPA